MRRGAAVHHVTNPAADAVATCGERGWGLGSLLWAYVDCARCLKLKPEEAVAR